MRQQRDNLGTILTSDYESNSNNHTVEIPVKKQTESRFENYGRNLENPFNRMVSDTASYFLFLGILITILINPHDEEGIAHDTQEMPSFDFQMQNWTFFKSLEEKKLLSHYIIHI